MSNRFGPRFCYALFVFAVGLNTSALADEGMWPFNAPPLKQLKEKYQFEPTSQWLEHLQKASVRFNSGGSGSFVSANGLVIKIGRHTSELQSLRHLVCRLLLE